MCGKRGKVSMRKERKIEVERKNQIKLRTNYIFEKRGDADHAKSAIFQRHCIEQLKTNKVIAKNPNTLNIITSSA